MLSDGTTITLVDITVSSVNSRIAVVACFLVGTLVATACGAVAVEDLRVGDQVVSAFGGSTDIIWIGHRQVDSLRHNTPEAV